MLQLSWFDHIVFEIYIYICIYIYIYIYIDINIADIDLDMNLFFPRLCSVMVLVYFVAG